MVCLIPSDSALRIETSLKPRVTRIDINLSLNSTPFLAPPKRLREGDAGLFLRSTDLKPRGLGIIDIEALRA